MHGTHNNGLIYISGISALCDSELWKDGGFHEDFSRDDSELYLHCNGLFKARKPEPSGDGPEEIGVCTCSCHKGKYDIAELSAVNKRVKDDPVLMVDGVNICLSVRTAHKNLKPSVSFRNTSSIARKDRTRVNTRQQTKEKKNHSTVIGAAICSKTSKRSRSMSKTTESRILTKQYDTTHNNKEKN